MQSQAHVAVRMSLVEKMHALRASARGTIEKLKTVDSVCADPIDHAALEITKDVELNCRHQDWRMLLDIQETILRIDRGLFGICDACGRPIARKRLKALPMTRLCVECQEEEEARRNSKMKRVRPAARKLDCHYA